MTQTNKGNTMVSTDRVRITVQAASAEIEDLVDVVVGRLEDMGLVLEKRSAFYAITTLKHQYRIDLHFEKALWLVE